VDKIKIVIVEDEAIIALELKTSLEELGYNIPGTAISGKEAINLAEEFKPNIILMDIQLKGQMDGTQAAHEISTLYNIPIIFITAFKDDNTFNLAKSSGAYAFITKPFDMRDVRNAIEITLFKHGNELQLLAQALQEKNTILENSSLEKDRFLATMSHELRTPLNAIIGFSGTLLMKLPGPLNADQERQLKNVKKSAEYLLTIVNDLLDHAKLAVGKVALTFEKVDCRKIIKDAVATISPLAESKNIELNVKIPRKDVMINTDKRALIQIIINLTSNAIKYTDKGEIKIELENHPTDTNKVYIHFTDTGIGIKPEDQTQLFQAFKQIINPGRPIEGTGLGLHLSQKLANLINGQIECVSEYGKGSRFSILLPKNTDI